ncbi:putative ATP-grasp-modified RiPP [Amycolatopsis coloradensis]|nr:putative ATP-grasp-modified RiPP [Amycolatopsis coloradensis]
MPLESIAADEESQDGSVTGPLSTIEIRRRARSPRASSATSASSPETPEQPLALRALRPAPRQDLPDYLYDPIRQVAVDDSGHPLTPNLAKEHTSLEGTHTDGDGGDNETWAWEENNEA